MSDNKSPRVSQAQCRGLNFSIYRLLLTQSFKIIFGKSFGVFAAIIMMSILSNFSSALFLLVDVALQKGCPTLRGGATLPFCPGSEEYLLVCAMMNFPLGTS